MREEEERFKQGKLLRQRMGGKKENGKFRPSKQFSIAAIQAHKRLADLLLAGANALRVEVPVGVEIANGHPQVLHGDHRAVGQVWKEGRQWRV